MERGATLGLPAEVLIHAWKARELDHQDLIVLEARRFLEGALDAYFEVKVGHRGSATFAEQVRRLVSLEVIDGKTGQALASSYRKVSAALHGEGCGLTEARRLRNRAESAVGGLGFQWDLYRNATILEREHVMESSVQREAAEPSSDSLIARSFEHATLAATQQTSAESRDARVRLDRLMAEWLEELVARERFGLVREIKVIGKDAAGYEGQLAVVRLSEKVLRYVRGSMADVGWREPE